MAPLISDQTGSLMAWQWQAANSEGQEGTFPTTHTSWPRGRKAWPGPWNPQLVTMGKQLLFTWAYPSSPFPPIAPLLFLGCYSSDHCLLCVTWQQSCYLNQIDRSGGFFPFYPLFCGITGQKYHKLVWMEVFLDIWAVATFSCTEKSQKSNKIWRASSGIYWWTSAAHSCRLGCCSPLQSSSYKETGFSLQVLRLGWKEPVWSRRLHRGSYGTPHTTSCPCPGH